MPVNNYNGMDPNIAFNCISLIIVTMMTLQVRPLATLQALTLTTFNKIALF